jgi:WD40 repeat protein
VAPAHIGFLSDGRLLVANADGKLEFRDVATGQRQAVGASIGNPVVISLSPDGRTIACCDAGGTVALFETSAFGRTNTINTGVAGVKSVGISPDGRTIALAGAGVVVWDIPGRRARTKLLENDLCAAVAFSGDGRLLAASGRNVTVLWETTFWQKQATLAGGDAAIRFWPARAAIVLAGGDRTVRIYDLATRQVQATLVGADASTDVAPSPDGRTIVTSGSQGLTVFDSTTRAARKLAGP